MNAAPNTHPFALVVLAEGDLESTAEVLFDANLGSNVVKVQTAGVSVVLGINCAEEIATALRFHQMNERGDAEEMKGAVQ